MNWKNSSGSKYKAKKTEVDGIVFASRREAARYQELKILQQAGEIAALQLQPRFSLEVNDKHIAYYIADFQYFSKDKQAWVVEDTKGVKTQTYVIKKKLFEAIYNKQILET
jgi:hypothetical protein